MVYWKMSVFVIKTLVNHLLKEEEGEEIIFLC